MYLDAYILFNHPSPFQMINETLSPFGGQVANAKGVVQFMVFSSAFLGLTNWIVQEYVMSIKYCQCARYSFVLGTTLSQPKCAQTYYLKLAMVINTIRISLTQ